MKRKSFRHRAIPFSTRVVKFINKPNDNSFRFSSVSEHSRIRGRKIFVIKQVQRLPATTIPGKEIYRIMIFDYHPDSLRLVFARHANSLAHPSDPGPMNSGSRPSLDLYRGSNDRDVLAISLRLSFVDSDTEVGLPIRRFLSAPRTHSKEGTSSNSYVRPQNPADAQ